MQAQSLWPQRFSYTSLSNKNRNRTTTVNNNNLRRISKAVTVRAMRAVVQRVASASVEVEGRIVSEIGPGLLVLVGIHDSDSDADADYMYSSSVSLYRFSNQLLQNMLFIYLLF